MLYFIWFEFFNVVPGTVQHISCRKVFLLAQNLKFIKISKLVIAQNTFPWRWNPGSKFIRHPCNSMHGSIWSVWFHMIPCMESMERKAKIRNSQNFKFSFYLRVIFRKQLENNWIWFELNWKTENDTIKPENRSASKLLGIRTWVFSFCKLCLQFGTESDIFGCDFRFFLDLVPVVLSVILDLILEVLPVVLDLILMFSIFQMSLLWFPSFSIWFNPTSCLQLYNSIRFHAWNHMITYDSMHGTILFHAIPCMETAWNYCMEPYGSMHGIAWKTYEFGSGIVQ